MQRGARLAGRGLGLLGRSFSAAAAEPAQAAVVEEGVQAAITGLQHRLAAGGEGRQRRRRTLLPLAALPACLLACVLTHTAAFCVSGPDLGDFIRGSDLSGYSVPAPRPKVR